MIYSCFNERLGLYEYFEDGTGHPTNADLPVPRLPSDAGRVGVPAREAGRPLPRGAKRAGTGWQARGIVVQCDNVRVQPFAGEAGDSSKILIVAGTLVAIYFIVAKVEGIVEMSKDIRGMDRWWES